MKNSVLSGLVVLACSWAGLGLAASDHPGSDDPLPPIPEPVFDSSLSIAYASVFLHHNGSDVYDWLEVEAYRFCETDPDPMPIPEPLLSLKKQSGDDDVSQPGDGDNDLPCDTSVYFTTSYEAFECPDGQVYFVRSGLGAYMHSPTDGTIFHWGESEACDDGQWPEPEPAKSKKRPLDLNSLKILN